MLPFEFKCSSVCIPHIIKCVYSSYHRINSLFCIILAFYYSKDSHADIQDLSHGRFPCSTHATRGLATRGRALQQRGLRHPKITEHCNRGVPVAAHLTGLFHLSIRLYFFFCIIDAELRPKQHDTNHTASGIPQNTTNSCVLDHGSAGPRVLVIWCIWCLHVAPRIPHTRTHT